MDFAGVNTVINYDFPTTTADYIHRVGRTGRAGHSGLAITFFTEHDAPRLRGVANLVSQAGSKVRGDWGRLLGGRVLVCWRVLGRQVMQLPRERESM